jgi:alkaline phosphatase D
MIVCLAALPALVSAPPASAARGFKLGVASAEVRARSAILWAKSTRKGPVLLQVRRKGRFRSCVLRRAAFRRAKSRRAPRERIALLRAKRTRNLTVQRRIRGLRPNTRYRYRFCRRGGRSAVGRFRTAPGPGANATIRFAWSGDQDAQPRPGRKRPHWNNFGILNRMRAERNRFNLILGDWIYSDTEVPGVTRRAITVPQKWRKYRQNLARPPLSRLRTAGAVYNHWDDHEFINDFSRQESRQDLGIPIGPEKLYRNGVRAFRDYAPVTYSRQNGIYRRIRWGRNLELFFLDERSFRSAKASAGGTCDNPPGSGDPDLAPTAPQTPYRDTFGLLIPQLQNPPPASCVSRINDPNRTLLGARQLARFKQAVRASTATFKVIVNEVPIQQFYALPYDRWEGYESERQEVLTHLRDNVSNVIFLTTDVHANMVNDARLQTLEVGGPVNTGILDVTTGPIATKSFEKEVDDVAGAGFGELARTAFFQPPPPGGVGMQCSAMDVFSYGQVTVTAAQLRIDLKDVNGNPVREGTGGSGAPCAPIVINAS